MEYTTAKLAQEFIDIPRHPALPQYARKVVKHSLFIDDPNRRVVQNLRIEYFDPETVTIVKAPGISGYNVELTASNDWVDASGPTAGRKWTAEEIETHTAAVKAVNDFPELHAMWQAEKAHWLKMPAQIRGVEPVEPIEPEAPTVFPAEEYDLFAAMGKSPVVVDNLRKQIIQARAAEPGSKINN